MGNEIHVLNLKKKQTSFEKGQSQNFITSNAHKLRRNQGIKIWICTIDSLNDSKKGFYDLFFLFRTIF